MMTLYRKCCVWRVLQYCVVLAWLTPQGAWAVSIQDLVGSEYVQNDPRREEEELCKWKSTIERRLTIQTGSKGRIVREGQTEVSSISGRRSQDKQCVEAYGEKAGYVVYAVEFYGSGRFQTTIVSRKDAGETFGGTIRILEDGKLIIFDYDDDGEKHAFRATSLRIAHLEEEAEKARRDEVDQVSSILRLQPTPDIELSCKQTRSSKENHFDRFIELRIWNKGVCSGTFGHQICVISTSQYAGETRTRSWVVDRATGEMSLESLINSDLTAEYQCQKVSAATNKF